MNHQPTVLSNALALSLIARTLEDTGNYRVLRKLPNLRRRYPLDEPRRPALAAPSVALIIDTETTGLDIATAKITEIGLLPVLYDEGLNICGVGAHYTGLQDPGEPLSEEVKTVTHMTDEMLKGQSIDWKIVSTMIGGASICIAQNAGFDRPIVERHIPEIAGRAWACTKTEIPWQKIGFPSTSQSAIATHLGYFYNAHRAMDDVDALAGILSLPFPVKGDRPDDFKGEFFKNLIFSARKTSFRIYATGSPFEAKDRLKARGYSWDADNKVWYRDIRDNTHAPDELTPVDQERIWLKENAGVRDARVTEFTARTRYK